jgi:hypothetical protein
MAVNLWPRSRRRGPPHAGGSAGGPDLARSARSSSRAAAAAGSRPERGSTRPRYLITSARVQVLFSCWASATAFCAARASLRGAAGRARPGLACACLRVPAVPYRWRDRRQAHAERVRELVCPPCVGLRDVECAVLGFACLEVGRLREMCQLTLRRRAAVLRLEPRRAGAQVRADGLAASGEHAHHVTADALDLEPVAVIGFGPTDGPWAKTMRSVGRDARPPRLLLGRSP